MACGGTAGACLLQQRPGGPRDPQRANAPGAAGRAGRLRRVGLGDMTTSSTFAIVGGGLAGAKAAEALRANDFEGHIVLFAGEEHLPYERPPLSKEYLAGKKQLGDFTVDSSAWYRDHHVELRLGTEVSAIDPAAHTVSLPDGSTLRYDKLLLATGSQPRRPPIPG